MGRPPSCPLGPGSVRCCRERRLQIAQLSVCYLVGLIACAEEVAARCVAFDVIVERSRLVIQLVQLRHYFVQRVEALQLFAGFRIGLLLKIVPEGRGGRLPRDEGVEASFLDNMGRT